jgi:hypothetical protein
MLSLKRNDLLRVVNSICTIVLTNQFESLFILGIQYLARARARLVIGERHRSAIPGLQSIGGSD